MTNRLALAAASLIAVCGCSQGVDPSQYKPYGQLESAQPSIAATATNEVPDDAAVSADEVVGHASVTEAAVELPVSAIAPLNVVDGSAIAAVLRAAGPTEDLAPRSLPTEPAASASKAQPGGIQVLVTQREFRAEGPKGAVRVSYDDLDLLKVLNMDRVPDDAPTYFPKWLHGLDGSKVRIRGFMFPTFEASGLDRFVLARDNQICCFGRDPKIYDLISVEMGSNRTTDYIPNRPFDVVGTFRIEMLAKGGEQMGLYWIEDAQVIDR